MRQGTPIPLSLEEHRELGLELRTTCAKLHQLCELVVSVYGSNTQAAFTFTKLTEAAERLLLDMQAQASHDHPGYPTEDLY